MTKIIADLHVHSGYSRATSKDMNVATMALWAKKKGINLLGTGDFTHPIHFANLKAALKSAGNGLYTTSIEQSVFFMLTAEISSIYSFKGKVRRVHNIIMSPGIEVAEKINSALRKRGNLSSDGRPILGTPAKDLLKIVLDISEDCLFVPAHAWTPWFSVFGSNSGFDSIEECFEEYSKYIYAIETGLSSDPEMNWRLSALDKITLISNSDAHSPGKLGREANIFNCKMDYYEILDAIKKKDIKRFLYTIEFFPEEGKYHYDGHRLCNILFSPEETKKHNNICPVCKKPLTVGVMNRVNEIADRKEGFIPDNAIPSKHMVPLEEIIAEAFNSKVNTVKVKREYEKLVALHTEFEILIDLPEAELYKIAGRKITEGILKVRAGDINIIPGYDGVYGRISIFSKQPHADIKDGKKSLNIEPKQRSLF
ncbi:MAG TPA: endonuclease Q family protein [Thermodesulfovibrionia bacterium]|nr:endonuclease Q family protein [Thermodesulfovibrionia bacterium]